MKTKATKGDSSVPLPKEDTSSAAPVNRVPLPDISAEEAETVTVEFLRDTYVDTIRYFLDRKDGKVGEGKMEEKSDESESLEKLLGSMEQVLIWFDQGDQWLKDLHDGKLDGEKS